ncbi:hypothetical protein BUALT_Bualt19G0060800 [Buddleja alternifolia]|uniref:Uncharacterized protein n=1 Tax=Buddleja alternifolia TaxID=168488 RepID=A0AAV6W1L0_9LAMI|nr:hypothetical protein BUALT_Bualt19G0060800 [Buddleja alternifolia]
MIEEMRDVELPDKVSKSNIENFERLLGDVRRELYPSCKKYSLLSFIAKLLHIKARKLLSGTGLGYIKIEACKYDGALFWKENAREKFCLINNKPCWKYNDGKGKWIPHKVLRYFLLKPRLQRLFISSKTASDMSWHAEKCIDVEGSLSHPVDSSTWKHFDVKNPNFAADPHNVRLGLATDGFNPFGNMSNSFSMWPVILILYIMPLYKCMKDEFFMMSLLIPGPRAHIKDIDVYLRPLIDELKELWNDFETYNVYDELGLAREDVEPNIVDEEFLDKIRQREHENCDDEDESSDEEDETLIEYYDDNMHNFSDDVEDDE